MKACNQMPNVVSFRENVINDEDTALNTILFVDDKSCFLPAIAGACLVKKAPANIMATVASNNTVVPGQSLQLVLDQYGMEWPEKILLGGEVDWASVDLVVSFSGKNGMSPPALPGMPALISWHVELPENDQDDFAWKLTLEQIQALLENLLGLGYLEALAVARKNSELIMDSMYEGIIAHDLNRRIFFFNRAAERITGFSRQEIIGRDCHDIFHGGICKSMCSFKILDEGHQIPDDPYLLNIISKDGQAKQLRMNVVEIQDAINNPVGVVASFRDLTSEYEFASRHGDIDSFAGIIGRDSKMVSIYQTVKELANSKVPVFIYGESGTGKELVASAIHSEGKRKDKLFVPVNCGALPENLLEAELFGHVKGAFTGATRDKKGRFELADGGTIFLDEIGDITPSMQVKLLRVLQDGTFHKVGGEETVQVDVRLLSATNKDLQKEIAEGRFRKDLYYRICVAPIQLPPLRQRKNDVGLLARHFLDNIDDSEKSTHIILAQNTIDALMAYDWPGNVRELQNVIRFLMFRCNDEIARPEHLPENIVNFQTKVIKIGSGINRRQKLNKIKVQNALQQSGNNRVKAAKILGVGRATLYRFLAKYPDV